MNRSLTERFWEKVDRRRPDECWPWRACKSKKGYGKIGEKGKVLYSHRVSYGLYVGLIPEGQHVLHTCDNPPCCNPKHLFLGSQIDNNKDRDKKGRQSQKEGHNSAKLTEESVAEIRRDYVRGSRTHGQPSLGRKYGVSSQEIGRIVLGKLWK